MKTQWQRTQQMGKTEPPKITARPACSLPKPPACLQYDEVKANGYCVEGFPLSYQLTIPGLVSATITS
jgi:hypothetical protein